MQFSAHMQKYILILLVFVVTPVFAASITIRFDPPLKASSGTRQGVQWVNYIVEIRVDGSLRRAKFVRVTKNLQTSKNSRTYGHWYANCAMSTLDGKLMPARPRYGHEVGSNHLLNLICDAK